jgi:hypothetical protein
MLHFIMLTLHACAEAHNEGYTRNGTVSPWLSLGQGILTTSYVCFNSASVRYYLVLYGTMAVEQGSDLINLDSDVPPEDQGH